MEPIIEQLLNSKEPSVQYLVRTGVLGEDPDSPTIQPLREEIRTSPRVITLLAERTSHRAFSMNVYKKWTGPHWIIAVLADIGYPPGDANLAPLIDEVCAAWLDKRYIKKIPTINGRVRVCASHHALALYSMLKLGFMDDRADRFAENLLRWPWPDGGWNCDRNPDAKTSSFWESWIPLRALSLYGCLRNNTDALNAASRASEVFLSRRLFRRLSDGSVMRPDFLQLCYPYYWRYSILNALKVMTEAGFIDDRRNEEALDILESKRLPDGGFSAEVSYFKTAPSTPNGRSAVGWGIQKAGQMNEWVTAEALSVLRAAGRY